MAYSLRENYRRALVDIWSGLGKTNLWPTLGWQEVRQRYRRSVLGPFWLTISTGLMVAGMGPLYGRLLNQSASQYITYMAAGLIIWQFLSALLTDACQVFIASEGFIKEMKLPLTVYVLRSVWKNLIIFLHNFVIILLALLYAGTPLTSAALIFPVSVLLILINGIWLHLLLGMLSARFRDVPLMVGSILQVLLFLTPIWWRPEMLGDRRWAADLNPMYHFVELVRAPLLGAAPTASNWLAAGIVTVIGFAITVPAFSAFRARVAYWV